MAAAHRVLVVGYRRALAAALAARSLPFEIWHNQPLARTPAGCERVRVRPFVESRDAVARAAKALGLGRFDYVIAGTEAAVVLASHLRRLVGARLSAHTTARRCHDKLFMKARLRDAGVPMTPFVDGNRAADEAIAVRALGLPVVVKERRSSGGRGIVVAHSAAELARLDTGQRLLERYVDAAEVSVESFVDQGRVRFENVTEYVRKRHVNLVPGALAPALHERVLAISRAVIAALAIEWGVCHVELFLAKDGPLFGEIALRPPGGYIMELLAVAYGFDAWDALVAVELGVPFEFPASARGAAAAIVLHPGQGVVRAVHGVEHVRADPRVVSCKIKVAAGDDIAARAGVGADVGHVVVRGACATHALEAVEHVERSLRIELEPA